MPIPFIIWGVVAGVSAIASAIFTVSFWDEILIIFKGKRIAILGDKATGKTTLHNFLTNGELKGGSGIEKTKSNALKLKDLEFYFSSSTDIAGSADFVNVWKDIIQKSDFTFYMVNSEKVFYNDTSYIKLIEMQLSMIGRYYKEASRTDKVCILCVFSDKVNNFIDNKTEFELQIKSLIERASMQVKCYIFVGSLYNQEYKEDLVYNLLTTIKN